MSKFVKIVYDFFKGMSSFIAPEKLPKTVLQVIENYDLMLQYGNLKKRRGYLNILTSGLTALGAMVDWVDKNGGRQLLLLDSTTLKESVYSGGAYQAVSAIANDERDDTTLTEMFPIVHNREVRSTAGIGDKPFWFGYIDSATRYKAAVTIAAGKYMCYKHSFLTSNSFIFRIGSDTTSYYNAVYVTQGTYRLYAAVLVDGYQKVIIPLSILNDFENVTSDDKYIWGDVIIFDSVISNLGYVSPRVTAIDIFIGYIPSTLGSDISVIPAYFLERIELGSQGDYFFTRIGTLDYTNQQIEIDYPDEDWLSFDPTHFYLRDETNDKDYFIDSISYIPGVSQGGALTIDVDAVNGDAIAVGDDAEEVELKFYSNWFSSTYLTAACKSYKFFFDDYIRKLGSEMYEYLNIPSGDLGLDDYKHKYGVIANNRYFGFGFPDGNAYFSPEYAYDVLPAQNIIRPVKDVVGCARSGRDVYMFYKTGGSRISVLSNMNIDQDDDFSDVGSCGQGSICQIDEDTFAFLSYKGPYIVQGRQKKFIGQDIVTWFVETGSLPLFTAAQKEACVADYNHNKRQVLFSFPTYATAPYTTGITLVFDISAFEMNFNPWTILKSDIALANFCRTDDNHLLGASTTKIVDFDGATQSESVATRLLFNLLRVGKRARMLFHKLYVDITTDDTITMNAYFDGSSSATALTALNSDNETNIKQIKQSMELEITTAASTNDVEVSGIELKVLPRKF